MYNARTGALLSTYALSTGGSFINDVVVTKRAAWFTDSFKPVLYRRAARPGRPTRRSLGVQHRDLGRRLRARRRASTSTASTRRRTARRSSSSSPSTGKLFTVSANGRNAAEIALAGGAERAERRRDPARRQDAVRRAEPAERHREDRARAEARLSGRVVRRIGEHRLLACRRRSPSTEAASTPSTRASARHRRRRRTTGSRRSASSSYGLPPYRRARRVSRARARQRLLSSRWIRRLDRASIARSSRWSFT